MNLRHIKETSTHNLMLIKCIQATDGAVLEMGSGFFSTPLLHWLCAERHRLLITYEDNLEYFNFANRFKSWNHRVRFTPDWNIKIDRHYSVALIDQTTKYRASVALALKDSVDYIILHDSQAEDHYKYHRLWGHFKYRYDYKDHYPWTTVLSNFNDLKWLESRMF